MFPSTNVLELDELLRGSFTVSNHSILILRVPLCLSYVTSLASERGFPEKEDKKEIIYPEYHLSNNISIQKE